MKRILGVVMVLILSPLAYLYAEKNLAVVQAQWNDYQSTIALNEELLPVGISNNGLNSLQVESADTSENQGDMVVSNENGMEEPIIDSMTNDVSDNVTVNDRKSDGGSAGNLSGQTNSAEKYSVITILGGTGKGIEDGKADKAKITRITDMVVDKNNNVFFIESASINIVENLGVLRKFDMDNNTVTTYLMALDEEMLEKMYVDNEDLMVLPTKLLYKHDTDKLYVSGKNLDSKEFVYDVAPIFQIS